MNGARFSITAMEIRGLADLVDQLLDMLRDPDDEDPALARLTPDAYPDDAEAGREFRRLTSSDLMARRVADATVMADSLAEDDVADPSTSVTLELDAPTAAAWLRTLSALRLVIAARLGVENEDAHAEDDPRFGVYDWLAYRLDSLVGAIDA